MAYSDVVVKVTKDELEQAVDKTRGVTKVELEHSVDTTKGVTKSELEHAVEATKDVSRPQLNRVVEVMGTYTALEMNNAIDAGYKLIRISKSEISHSVDTTKGLNNEELKKASNEAKFINILNDEITSVSLGVGNVSGGEAGVALGIECYAGGGDSNLVVGIDSSVLRSSNASAIGLSANVEDADNAFQLGSGTNKKPNTFKFRNTEIVNENDKIPIQSTNLVKGKNINFETDEQGNFVISATGGGEGGTSDYLGLENLPREIFNPTTSNVNINSLKKEKFYDVIKDFTLINDNGAKVNIKKGAIMFISDSSNIITSTGCYYIDENEKSWDEGYNPTMQEVNDAVNSTKTRIVTDKDNSVIPAFELANNTEYRFTLELESIEFTLTDNPTDDYISSIVFKSGATATTITYPDTIKWTGDDISSDKFVPASIKTYEVLIYWNGFDYCGIVKGW